MVFQPMLELLGYLRDKGFRTYIVSGGEVAFMRASQKGLRHSPEQVIGTTLAAEYQDKDGQLSIQRLPKLLHNDDGPGKPVSIEAVIGRQRYWPSATLTATCRCCNGPWPGRAGVFAGLVHHTDANREWAYDRQSSVGRLDKALDIANRQGWTVVDMARDWRRVYPFDKE
jgi:hypothetical protein